MSCRRGKRKRGRAPRSERKKRRLLAALSMNSSSASAGSGAPIPEDPWIDPATLPRVKFEELFAGVSARAGRRPSPRLALLLKSLHEGLGRSPQHERELHGVLCDLRELLIEEDTDDNRDTVSNFVLAENEWEMDWSYLPDDLEDIMFHLACASRRWPVRR